MEFNTLERIGSNFLPSNEKEIKKESKTNFNDLLKFSLDNLNKLELEANEYKKQLITGELENTHELMIATEKANIAMQLTLAVRNKVVDAYREIMRMQI